MLKLFTGQLGGAVADLAGLIGEVVAVERSPIEFSVQGGKGRLTIGKIVDADMAPFVGATGNPTTLAETVFSTVPGSPVYASKASQYTRDGSAHGSWPMLMRHTPWPNDQVARSAGSSGTALRSTM